MDDDPCIRKNVIYKDFFVYKFPDCEEIKLLISSIKNSREFIINCDIN